MYTDPIADMLTRIRNGYLAHKHEVTIPYSKLKAAIAQVLATEGFVATIEKVEEGKGGFPELKVRLKYVAGRGAITNVQRISKPSRRAYVQKTELPHVQSGYGVAIVSTSKGIMTNKQARALGVGGELVCTIW